MTSGSARNSVSSPSASSIRLLRIASGRLPQLLSPAPGRPVLKLMGRDVLHMAATGSGALIKLINNFVCGVQAASFGEALALIEHSGLNREQALQVLNDGAPGSPLVKIMSQRMTSRNYDDVNFALQLMLKDLNYANKEAGAQGVRLNTGLAAAEVFDRARERGWGKKDFSSVVEGLR